MIPRTDIVKVYEPLAHNMVFIFFGGIWRRERGRRGMRPPRTQIVPNDGVSSPRGLAVATHTFTLASHCEEHTMLLVKVIHKIVAVR